MKSNEVPWGPLGYITYKRTYARRLKEADANSPTEEFNDTVNRVVDGCRKQLKVGFTEKEEKRLKEIMMGLKGTVAGRFFWQLGTKTVDKLGLFSLQNCAFVVVNEPIKPFIWTMDALMLGSGVGYNIQKEHVYELPKVQRKKVKIVRQDSKDADFIVPDSREGWVELLRRTLEASFYTGKGFSYSTICIRGKGTAIKGFGGLASGPEELCWGIEEINKLLNDRSGKKLNPVDCLDIMNIIGAVVVAGNVRRSAQIAIGDMDDLQYLNAKRWDLGNIPNWRAMSNNSVVCNDVNKLPDQFWQGYMGNGEPYGLINLKLSREVGRTGEAQYPDPDVQGYNPCVTGDTTVLTSEGYKRIDSLIGTKVNVWNGFEWSEVTPKITGKNQKILKISFSDGRELKCTPYHKFHLSTDYKGGIEKVEALDLKIGNKLIKHEFPVIEFGKEENLDLMYTQGFYSADGVAGSNFIWLYEPKYSLESFLSIKSSNECSPNQFGTKRKQLFMEKVLFNKNYVPLEYDLKSRLSWLSGLLDGDGCELKEGGVQIASVDFDFLNNVQNLISLCGVNSKIVHGRDSGLRKLPNGKGDYDYYECKELKRICIGAKGIQDLLNLGLSCKRLEFKKTPNRDASRFSQVVKIEEYGESETVYCFNEPKRHLGIFNGVITGQCAEQSLANYETCCLAEIHLQNIESEEELFEVATYLYRINKHSLALKCHQESTQEIVNANMRMGIGVTGYAMATKKQKSWLSKCYVKLREFDKEYSAKHGFPESIKLTTVKPSGTLSLLSGATPGAHPGYSHYHIRRIRIASNSPLVEKCKQSGYHVEYVKKFDGTDDRSTVVVEFPCKFPKHTVVADDCTAIDQLEIIKELQSNWSDNSVSCTIYYQKNELPRIKRWLKNNFNNGVKTCSFLLHSEHGFEQAPLQEITKDEYDEIVKRVQPITDCDVKESDISEDQIGCEGGACPIK